MKKLKLFFPLAAMLFMASCSGDEPQPAKTSLSVASTKLEFASSGAESQTFTVTAVNVKWETEVAASGKDWITVTPDGDVVGVTVTDNPTAEVRTGTVLVKPIDNEEIRTVGVTIVQEAGEGPGEYSISVDPASLTFASDATEPQEVTVTTKGEGLTWTAAAEEKASWLHVEKNGDKIIVSVDAYEDIESSRAANIVVTPSDDKAAPKSVRVTQEPATAVPSFSVTPMDDIHFEWNEEGTTKLLTVNAVVVKDYGVRAVDEEENAITWIKLKKSDTETTKRFSVSVDRNPTLEDRTGYIIVYPLLEGVDDIRIKVTQDAGKEFISNLTGNVEITDMNLAGGFYGQFKANQIWDTKTEYTYWIIEMWSDGLTRALNKGYYEYTGTGNRVRFQLFSPSIRYNNDEVFYFPDGEYNMYAYDYPLGKGTPYTLVPGRDSNDLRIPIGSWYSKVEDGKFTDTAPIVEGKFTVTKDNNDVYTITFDLKDDAGYSITGTCVSPITELKVSYFPENPPSDGGGDGGDDGDPDFGQ